MKTKTRLGLSIFLLLFLVQTVNAVTIESGTDLYASGINLTINFTDTAYADIVTVESGSIYFENYSRDNGNEVITMNITEANITYNHTALPYFSSSTSTSKTITSTLADTITTDVLIEPRDCNVGVITQTYPDGTQTTFTDYDCNNNIITLTSVSLPTGVSTLSISNCTGYERIWYPIITLMLVLSLLLFIYFFIIKDNENLLDGITVNKILILFISITLIIIFITVIADNMAGRCPV